jgi:formyl-CoA transferase
MQEAVMLTTLQTGNENYWHWHRTVPGRRGLAALGARSIFQAADGQWVSFTIPPPYWGAYTIWVAGALGRDEFQSERWQDRAYQIEHAGETTEATAALCAAMPRDRLVEEGQHRHLLVLPVNDVAALAADPHLQARGFFRPVRHEQFGRTLTMPAPPFLSSAWEAATGPAPLLGQHTREVLRDLGGLSDSDIARLIEQGTAAEAGAPVEAAHG